MTNIMKKPSYNGWANYETWNVALFINNDYGAYVLAKYASNYNEFVSAMHGNYTMDGVSLTDSNLDKDELNGLITELNENNY